MSLTLTFDKPAGYNPGDKITATYGGLTVNPGSPAVPDTTITAHGSAVEDGTAYAVDTTTVIHDGKPAVPADTVTYNAPTAPGLTFVATSDPKVWTATAP